MKSELHVASQDEQEGGQIPKGGKNKGGEWKCKTASHRSHEPDFLAESVDFHGISGILPELSFVRYVESCYPPVNTIRRKHLPRLRSLLQGRPNLTRVATLNQTALYDKSSDLRMVSATRRHTAGLVLPGRLL